MTWRPMTADELVTRPEARLGGSLLAIVVGAAVLSVAGALCLVAGLVFLPAALTGGTLKAAFRGPAGLGLLYSIPVLFLMAWAIGFWILTMMRSPAGPTFAATGLVAWIGVRLLIAIVGQFWVASRYSGGSGLILQSVLPMLLSFIGEAMLAAGFWVYMRDGERPNGYYRRLVRA